MLEDTAERSLEIRLLEQRIAELHARLPKHSVPPAMMLELDDLEDELRALRETGNRAPEEPEEE